LTEFILLPPFSIRDPLSTYNLWSNCSLTTTNSLNRQTHEVLHQQFDLKSFPFDFQRIAVCYTFFTPHAHPKRDAGRPWDNVTVRVFAKLHGPVHRDDLSLHVWLSVRRRWQAERPGPQPELVLAHSQVELLPGRLKLVPAELGGKPVSSVDEDGFHKFANMFKVSRQVPAVVL